MAAKTKSIQFERIFIVADWKQKLNQNHQITASKDGILGTIKFINFKSTQLTISAHISLPSQNIYDKYSMEIVLGQKRKIWNDIKNKWCYIKLNKIVKPISKHTIVLNNFAFTTKLNHQLSTFQHCWIRFRVNLIKNVIEIDPKPIESNANERNEDSDANSTRSKYSQFPNFEPTQSEIHEYIQKLSPKFIKRHQIQNKIHRRSEYGQLVLPTLFDIAKQRLLEENKKKYLHQNYKSRCKVVDYSQMESIKPTKSNSNKWSKYLDKSTSRCNNNNSTYYKFKHAPKANYDVNILSEVSIVKPVKQSKHIFAKSSLITSPFEPSEQDIQEVLNNMNQQEVHELRKKCIVNENKDPYLVVDTIQDVIRRNILNRRQQLYHKLRKSRAKTSILKNHSEINSKHKKTVQINLNKNRTKIVSRWINK